MSFFDQIAGMLPGHAQTGEAGLPSQLIGMLASQPGGLQGLVSQFESAGLGGVMQSWVANGSNQAVAPDQVHQALGSEQVDQLAQRTGLPVQQVLQLAAQYLPQIVNHMTPEGEVPQNHSFMDAGLSFLKQMAGTPTPPAPAA